jgi:hypothetical protein
VRFQVILFRRTGDGASPIEGRFVLGRFGASLVAVVSAVIALGIVVLGVVLGYLVAGLILAAIFIAMMVALVRRTFTALRR